MQAESPNTLVDVFVLRSLAAATVCGMEQQDSEQLEFCLQLHGIVRQRSYLTADGRRMLCHFRAPDAESLRMALRGARIEYDEVWTAKDKDISDTTWRESHD
jgi:hypothetical protein